MKFHPREKTFHGEVVPLTRVCGLIYLKDLNLGKELITTVRVSVGV